MNKKVACAQCGHEGGNCDCWCCCSVSKLGCPSCIIPAMIYRAFLKLKKRDES